MKVLITGFEPFGGQAVNPSWEAVSRLPERIGTARLVRLCLPVEYERAPQMLREAMEREAPDCVICVGQAGGRAGITPELVAINMADAQMADSAGVTHRGERLIEGAPDAHFATLDVRAMVAGLKKAHIPAALSYSAGAYVCNSVMFCALDAARPGQQCGFIHVPYSGAQAAQMDGLHASLPLEDIVRGLEICVREAINQERRPIA